MCLFKYYNQTAVHTNAFLTSSLGLLAAGINAATLALIDAGISMSDYTAACTVGFDQNSKSVLVDLNYIEEGSECGMLTVAVDRATGKLTSLGLECRVHLQWYGEMCVD
jgi:exosome complex component RRP41